MKQWVMAKPKLLAFYLFWYCDLNIPEELCQNMAADGPVTCVAKPLAAMVLTMLDRRVLVSHREGFQQLCSLTVGIYNVLTHATIFHGS